MLKSFLSAKFVPKALIPKISFSFTEAVSTPTATVVDGKGLSRKLMKEYKHFVTTEIIEKGLTLPKLSVILVGNKPDSVLYVDMKKKACDRIGILGETFHFDEKTDKHTLISKIKELNQDPRTYGILLQLPLPENLKEDTTEVIETIDIYKDLDGLTVHNLNPVSLGRKEPSFTPCTVAACLYILKEHKVGVAGKKVCVIGKSVSVGLPLAKALSAMGAIVTSCDRSTRDLAGVVSENEIVISAAGSQGLVKGEWLMKGCVAIDVGITRIIVNDKPKVVGDFVYETAKEKCSLITPVPGGVGPLTIAILMQNLLKSWCIRHNVHFPFDNY